MTPSRKEEEDQEGGIEDTVSSYSASWDKLWKIFSTKVAKLSSITSLYDYSFRDILYKGSISSIYLASKRINNILSSVSPDDSSHDLFTIKVLSKNFSSEDDDRVARIENELSILEKVKADCVCYCRIRESFESRSHVFIVMDYEPFGDCQSLLERLQYKLPEDIARGFLAEVSYALKYVILSVFFSLHPHLYVPMRTLVCKLTVS